MNCESLITRYNYYSVVILMQKFSRDSNKTVIIVIDL